jgi:hypothetical protein
MEREVSIADRIREVARGRLGREAVTPKGDMIVEELDADVANNAEDNA